MTLENWLHAFSLAQVGAVVLAAALTIPVFLLTVRVNAIKDDRAAAAELEIAEANERAEQARLELAKLKQPRTIPSEYGREFVERLTQHKGQQFEIAGAGLDPEAMSLMTELVSVLTAAGWKHIDSQLGGMSASVSGNIIGTPVAANDVGVVVMMWQKGREETGEQSSSRFGKVGPAHVDLINLLNAVGISTTTTGPLESPVKNRHSIRIEVGRKPQPSSTWESPLRLIPVIEDSRPPGDGQAD